MSMRLAVKGDHNTYTDTYMATVPLIAVIALLAFVQTQICSAIVSAAFLTKKFSRGEDAWIGFT